MAIECRLGDIALIKQGRYLPPAAMAGLCDEATPIPVWGANGIIGFTDVPSYEEGIPLVTCRGNGCGLVQWTQGPAYISNNAMAIIPTTTGSSDRRFMYYALLSTDFADVTTGSAQPQITIGHLSKKLLFWSADKSERAAIAHILGTLDDKIELNGRMNETLEALARALFRSWFVNFDPVRTKANGGDSGLPQALADLFPDSLENSKFGEIPQGWTVQSLRELAQIFSGGTPSKSVTQYWNGPLPWISPKAMNNLHVDSSDETVTPAAVGNGTRLVQRGSVLVMVRGMGLHQGVRISQAQCDVTFNQDVKAFVPKWGDGTFLLFALLDTSSYLFSKVQASGHGTGVLPTDILESLTFAVPPMPARDKLVEPLANLNSKIAANSRESEYLIELRDTLLPKLISGKLRVSDAQKLVEVKK